jgi:hypothetical protein
MNKKKQKYWLVLHSRADETIAAEQKHSRFFERLGALPAPWGSAGRPAPPVPSFGRSSSAVISLTKYFGGGVQRAVLSYRYRRLLNDDHLSDDLLSMTFDPAKVDVRHLTYTVIPMYTEAFGAYLVEYFDDTLIDVAWDTSTEGRSNVNLRTGVNRIDVVGFYDDLLCRRAFNLTPAEVLHRLTGKVEHGRLLDTGVYFIGSSRVLPVDEAQRLAGEIRAALGGMPPACGH